MNYVIYILLFILIFIFVFILDTIHNKYRHGGRPYSGGSHSRQRRLHSGGSRSGQRRLYSDHDKQQRLYSDSNGKQLPHSQRCLRSGSIISSQLLFDILNIIKKRHYTSPNYNIMNSEDISFYERQAHLLENKYKIKYEILKDQLFSIRGGELLVYISQCSGKVKSMSKMIKEDFENGFDITLIADKHKLPYIMTLKQLFFEYKYSKEDIKKFLKKEKKLPTNLQSINSELDFILKSDPTSYINNLNNKKEADAFEKEVAAFLDSKNIKYITENDQRLPHNNKQCLRSGGGKFLNNQQLPHSSNNNKQCLRSGSSGTPDFLFNEATIINKCKAHWIEVKNYAYYGNKILDPGIRDQANKYYSKYGSGIFIFKYGIIEDIIKNPINNGVYFMGWEIIFDS